MGNTLLHSCSQVLVARLDYNALNWKDAVFSIGLKLSLVGQKRKESWVPHNPLIRRSIAEDNEIPSRLYIPTSKAVLRHDKHPCMKRVRTELKDQSTLEAKWEAFKEAARLLSSVIFWQSCHRPTTPSPIPSLPNSPHRILRLRFVSWRWALNTKRWCFSYIGSYDFIVGIRNQ